MAGEEAGTCMRSAACTNHILTGGGGTSVNHITVPIGRTVPLQDDWRAPQQQVILPQSGAVLRVHKVGDVEVGQEFGLSLSPVPNHCHPLRPQTPRLLWAAEPAGGMPCLGGSTHSSPRPGPLAWALLLLADVAVQEGAGGVQHGAREAGPVVAVGGGRSQLLHAAGGTDTLLTAVSSSAGQGTGEIGQWREDRGQGTEDETKDTRTHETGGSVTVCV